MENTWWVFKAFVFLHFLGGGLLFALVMDPDFQKTCIYEGRSWIVAEIQKILIFCGALSLVVGGILCSHKPAASVVAAWASLGLYFLTWVVDSVANRKFHVLCKACALNYAIRVSAASALTWAFLRGPYG